MSAFAIAMGLVVLQIIMKALGKKRMSLSDNEPTANYIGDDYCQYGMVDGGGLSPAFPSGSEACSQGSDCVSSGGTPFWNSIEGVGGQVVCEGGNNMSYPVIPDTPRTAPRKDVKDTGASISLTPRSRVANRSFFKL